MKLFLWNQKDRRVDSRTLLKRAILQYETAKQNTEKYGGSKQDSLFEFELRETSGGKPYAVDRCESRLEIEVSVTHTGDWWLCAVGRSPMGIDAELRTRAINPALARRICTEDETAWLERETKIDPEGWRKRLLWLWVRKEAYVKYLGTGIKEGLNTFSVVQELHHKSVHLRTISEEAADELLAAVYCPEEEIEGYEWILM